MNLKFTDWRFNQCMSNTEPLLCLNVEIHGNRAQLEDKSTELMYLLESGWLF